MLYPKINSLYKRERWYFDEIEKKSNKKNIGHSLIIGDYARPEFGCIKKWSVQEKIDGTNIRVHIIRDHESYTIAFHGREHISIVEPYVIDALCKLFNTDTLGRLCAAMNFKELWLFGEGYGPKIQKAGSLYRKDIGFILFDACWDGSWVNQAWVMDIADMLGIPYAPFLGVMTEQEIVEYVKSQPTSVHSQTPQTMEGIIARPEYPLLFQHGTPLMFKLKCKEFVGDKPRV